MITQQSTEHIVPFSRGLLPVLPEEALAFSECDRRLYGCPVNALREALAREAGLRCEKEAMLQQQETLRCEADHRLLNGLQMVVSLLSLQSRASTNADVTRQLSIAGNRVASIERVHRQLHSSDGAMTVDFKNYLEELCRDLAGITALDGEGQNQISFKGIEMTLPGPTAIPLGFIANELITNAVKYGGGQILVELRKDPAEGHMLSVSNEGRPLPPDYSPSASKGLGMKIIRSLVRQIGGTFRFDCGDLNRGPRFMVLFA